MSPGRWNHVERIFHSALACPDPERPAFLDQSCGDDPDLRRQVEILLDAQARAGSFLASGQPPLRLADLGADSVPAGKCFGQYRILSVIGAGAMGEVYLAHDTRLDRRVAVKVLPGPFTRDRGRVARFMREAKAVSSLNHPNIVTVHDGGVDNGQWFIATEFIEGVTLRQRMAARRLDPIETLDIALQCAAALDAAHRAGVVHRDVKPENIMLRPDGVVKIVDFGLARITAAEDPSVTGTHGGAMGTPRYMAPEQARGEKSDASADIFSLGAVLYEMAAGRFAFPGATTAEVFAAVLTADPAPPSACGGPSLPELDAIVAKALAKDRASRYPAMRDFASDLKKLKQRLEAQEAPPRGWHRHAAIGLAAAMAIAGAFAWHWQTSATERQPDTPAIAVPITSFAGFKDYPALSPDGTRIAFSWNGGQGGKGGKQERNIYVKPVSGGDPVQLTGSTEDNLWPTWSPDGRLLAFGRRVLEGTTSFYVLPVAGGPERKVAEGGAGVSWSPDGKTLALARLAPPQESGAIFVANIETGEQRELTSPKPNFDNKPVFSPDGKWIAFTRGATTVRREIWVMPSNGGAAQRLTAESEVVGLTWAANGDEIVFGVHAGTTETLWCVASSGGEPKRVAVTTDDASNPSISPRAARLVYTQSFIDTNIYRSEGSGFASASAPGQFGPARALIVASREDHSPAYSPESDRIAFISTRSGNSEIWVAQRDGARPAQLTSFEGPVAGTPRWSPDGRWIALDCSSAGNVGIYVIGADGGSPRRITTGSSAEFLPSWSPDGKWIYFTSDRSGSWQIWKTPFAGGSPIQVTRNGVRESWPSPDGKLIYFTKRRPESEIWSVPAEGGVEQPVPELQAFPGVSRAWGVIHQGIYFISREDAPHQIIRFFSFATRRVTSLATLEKEPVWIVPAIALSPDGRSLLTVHLDHEVNDLMLVDHFR